MEHGYPNQRPRLDTSVGNLTALPDDNFRWDIPHFYNLSYDIGFYADSPTFRWQDAAWFLRIYPNGRTGSRSDYMWFSLVRQDEGAHEHRVEVTLSILRGSGKSYHEYFRRHTFAGRNLEIGVYTLTLNRRSLQCQQRPTNFEVSFSCHLSVVKPAEAKADDSTRQSLTAPSARYARPAGWDNILNNERIHGTLESLSRLRAIDRHFEISIKESANPNQLARGACPSRRLVHSRRREVDASTSGMQLRPREVDASNTASTSGMQLRPREVDASNNASTSGMQLRPREVDASNNASTSSLPNPGSLQDRFRLMRQRHEEQFPLIASTNRRISPFSRIGGFSGLENDIRLLRQRHAQQEPSSLPLFDLDREESQTTASTSSTLSLDREESEPIASTSHQQDQVEPWMPPPQFQDSSSDTEEEMSEMFRLIHGMK